MTQTVDFFRARLDAMIDLRHPVLSKNSADVKKCTASRLFPEIRQSDHYMGKLRGCNGFVFCWRQ